MRGKKRSRWRIKFKFQAVQANENLVSAKNSKL